MKTIHFIFAIAALLLVTIIAQAQEIFDAVKNNDLVRVKELIDKDGNQVHLTKPQGNSPLHITTQIDRKEIAELRISRGADLESKTISELTPLNLLALMTDHYEMAKPLVEEGADINTKAKNGSTPLSNAAHRGSLKIIDLLLDHHAMYDTMNGGAISLLHRSAGIGSVRLFKYISDKEGK